MDLLQSDEYKLISGIQKGDKDAFKEFINLYKKFVINICYKFVSNEEDANDIAQEVFIEVYHTLNKFRGDSKVSTWLYRISVNRSLNFIRDNKKYKLTESYPDESSGTSQKSASESTPESVFIDKERKQILDRSIDSLPDNQKAAFVLSKKEGLSYDEISKVLGLSLKAIDSLLMRAKKNLQKMLVEYYS